mmetsp:Transcript_37158/g.85795  ORF Transcript_37158/g.85795 Transcript_37158/m.85795 type:complete len:91 (-) Transcript_37158:193-465(-)
MMHGDRLCLLSGLCPSCSGILPLRGLTDGTLCGLMQTPDSTAFGGGEEVVMGAGLQACQAGTVLGAGGNGFADPAAHHQGATRITAAQDK